MTYGAVIEACALGSELILSQMTLPSSARAVEHSDVEVSMRMILLIAIC